MRCVFNDLFIGGGKNGPPLLREQEIECDQADNGTGGKHEEGESIDDEVEDLACSTKSADGIASDE